MKFIAIAIALVLLIATQADAAANIDRFHATMGIKVDGKLITKYVFNQVASKTWVKLDIATGHAVATYKEVGRDQWSVYLDDGKGRIFIDYWTKKLRGSNVPTGVHQLYIVPTKKYSEIDLINSPIKGHNVYHAVLGTKAGVEVIALQKAGKTKWVSLNLVDGKRVLIDTFAEVQRDQWSVYFKRGTNYYTAVDLWTRYYKLGWNKTPIMSVLEFSG